MVVGHKCTIKGRMLDESRVQKILDWPICRNLTEVRGFLGTLGTIRIFIKDFAAHARPLVQLTRKDVKFEFAEEQVMSMEKLKLLAQNCTAIRAIDYDSDREVTLAVDASWMAVGFILSQQGFDGKRYPSRYGSITWNETEQRYSQAKLELYGLFRALKAVKMYIIGVKNFVVEVDAKYIKGMINNPDIQPSATINRWIAGILMFNFKLRHVSAKDHAPADGLSRRRKSPDDPEIIEESEDEDDVGSAFSMQRLNDPQQGVVQESITDHDPRIEERDPAQIQFTQTNAVMTTEVLKIPRSEKALIRDEKLKAIKEFLNAPVDMSAMPSSDQRRFIKSVSEFFVSEGKLWRKDKQGRHKLVIWGDKRLELIRQAHDELGHKGVFTVTKRLEERFWWPYMALDVKWFVQTCHECQVRLVKKIIIPPTVAAPAGLFRKVYIDTMLMPKAKGYRYIIHARCSLTSYPEWTMVRNENFKTIAKFIFEDLLCRWGALEILVSDNAPQYLQAAEYLAQRYHIHHIKISPYNSRAQGPIERRHFDVRETLLKAADGDVSRWPDVAAAVFWAERVTIQKSTGYSPYYLAHGVEPLFPFDLAEATYLAPELDNLQTTGDLIAKRAIMLQKRPQDLARVRQQVLKARWEAVKQLEKDFKNKIIDYNFPPGTLVLVRNSKFDKILSDKTKPRYFGPMVVIKRTNGGSYVLGELDGSISKLRFAAFRLIPYRPRDLTAVPVTKESAEIDQDFEEATHDSGNPLDVEQEDDL